MTAVADAIRKELGAIDAQSEKLQKRRTALLDRLRRLDEKYLAGISTIDALVEKLARMPQRQLIARDGEPVTSAYLHAYRMSGSTPTLGVDLFWREGDEPISVASLTEALRTAVGTTFEHRKGAEYTMTGSSPVRLCDLHDIGPGVFGVRRSGGFVELVTRPEP